MILINEDDSVDIKCGEVTLHVKHNDVGVSIDYYTKKSTEPVKSDWVLFEDLIEDDEKKT